MGLSFPKMLLQTSEMEVIPFMSMPMKKRSTVRTRKNMMNNMPIIICKQF